MHRIPFRKRLNIDWSKPALLCLTSMACYHAMAVEPLAAPAVATATAPATSAAPAPSAAPAAPATAQAAPDATPVQRVEVLGSGNANARRNETATKIVVNRNELLLHGDSNLPDALKRQPGVSVVGGEIRLRGLGSGYTQILVNGDPAPPGFSIETLSPELVERIEILRSATAEYSTQAIAGTINVILRKSVSKASREVKLGLLRDQGRWSPSATLTWADRSDGFSYSVASSFSRTGYHRSALVSEIERDSNGQSVASREFREQDYAGVHSFNLTPRLNWTLANGDTINWQTLLDHYRFSSSGDQIETVLSGTSSEYPHNNWTSESHTTSVRSDVSWAHRISNDAKLNTRFGINHNQRNTDYTFYGVNRLPGHNLIRSVASDAIDDNLTTSGKYLSSLFSGHSLALGWDGTLTRRSEARLQHDKNPQGTPLGDIDEDYTANVRRLALFAQDEWDVTQRLQAYLGLRWEGLDTATEGRSLARVHNRSSVWSPVMQILWKLPDSEKDQVRVALSRTYKAPATRNLVPRRYSNANNNSPTNPDTQGNPDLRPELAWGLDLAYETYFGKTGMFSVSTFVRRIQDVTVQEVFEQNGVWISTPYNKGNARVYGLELDTKFPLNTWIANAPAIDVRANLAINRSRLDSIPGPNNRLAEQTPLSANLGLDYRMSGTVSMGGSLNFQGGGPAQVSRTLENNSGVTRVLDLYALWKLDKVTQLRLSMSNVLRQDRVQSRYFNDGNGSNLRTTNTQSTAGVRVMLERSL